MIDDWVVPERLRQTNMVVRYTAGDGRKRFHGGAQLKASQSYPAGLLDQKKVYFLLSIQQSILFHKLSNCTIHWLEKKPHGSHPGLAVP